MAKLTSNQKEEIAVAYEKGATQTALAEKYNVHRRTIQRALIEMEMLPPEGMSEDLKRKGYKLFTEDQQKILELCRHFDIDSDNLTALIKQVPLTGSNMVKVFALMSNKDKLAFLQESRKLKGELREAYAQAS